MRNYLLFSAALAALLLAASVNACGGEPSTELPDEANSTFTVEPETEQEIIVLTPTVETDEATKTPTPAAEATEVELSSEVERVVQLSKADLAQSLGLALEDIQLVSVEAVDWPDGSLGCPQPGMMYAQVITPGFRLVLKLEDEVYEYHFGGGQGVLCNEDQLALPQADGQQPVSGPYIPPPISTREIVRPPWQ